MTTETALRWSWMNVLTKKRYDMLLQQFGNLETALAEVSVEMLQELGCREETVLGAMNRLEEFDPDFYLKELQKRDINFLSLEDDAYPEALKTIADPPIFFYYKGDMSILRQPCLSLVGRREMSDYGKRAVAEIVPGIVTSGVITVSGLAYGIDAEVAKETMTAGGKTVAVVGHGLGMIHPKSNERLAKSILEKGGLIVSEYPLDAFPDKYTFPARNRIIAGLSLGTVVIEAAEGSGSLITAELALEYGRDVFAVPGQIFDPGYAGCHQLISRGHAKLVSSATDILSEIGILPREGAQTSFSFTPESPDEESVYGSLTTMPADLDNLSVKTTLDAATLNAILTVLEIKGAVKNVGGGKWVRS